MSFDNATAVAAASSPPTERSSGRLTLRGLLAAPFVALWKQWSTPDNLLDLRQYSEAELVDMGASPEVLSEAQALREFEQSRAHALSLYYW